MRVVALFRVSTERQQNEGASLDAQQRRYRELAASMDWETVEEFRGQESATKAASEREVLQRVLACIREQPVSALWVYEQSRLTRGDELEVALLTRELREREVRVLVGATTYDLAEPSSALSFGIQSVVDRHEAQRFKERVGRGKAEKARQGKWICGPAPFGYLNPPPGDSKRGVLQVHPEEAVVVRRIFNASESGEGFRTIAACLNREGIPSPRGGKWGKSSVRNILENRVYCGCTPQMEDAHEALIPLDRWETIQAVFRGHKSPRPQLLSGLLYIEGTKAVVDNSRVTRQGARGTFYHPQREHGGWVRTDTLNAAVWGGFLGLLRHPEALSALLRRASQGDGKGDGRARLADLTAQRARLDAKAARLVDLVADGTLSREDYRRKAAETEAQIREVGQQEIALRRRLEAVQGGAVDRAVQALAVVISGKLSEAQRRKLLQSVVARVDVELLRRPGKRTEILEASLGLRTYPPVPACWDLDRCLATVPIVLDGKRLEPVVALRLARAA